MAQESAIPRPVQVFLDTRRFIISKKPRDFNGGHRDFYEDNDRGFAAQKYRVQILLRAAALSMRSKNDPAGFLRVQMRHDALGKSYRPLGSLFTKPNGFALVGAGRVGEIIFQATPQSLDRLDRVIDERAEATPRLGYNKKTDRMEPRPSGYRSEVGAIGDIELYGQSDRLEFSAEAAVAWLKQPNIIGGYIIELFRPDPERARDAIAYLVRQLNNSLAALPSGIEVKPFLPDEDSSKFGEPSLTLNIQLLRDPKRKSILLPFSLGGTSVTTRTGGAPARDLAERDLETQNHKALLDILSQQALVRSVDLPPVIEGAPASVQAGSSRPNIPAPSLNASYPIVGIIDGGVATLPELGPWRAGDAGLVIPADRDESHGTFIAGLVAAGASLNPHLSRSFEPTGCKFYDLDLFPRKDLRQKHFGNDIDYLFDILDEKVKVAKRDHKVRIFNLSFGLRIPGSRMGYSVLADRLDRLARANDVILVISAGNLPMGSSRPAWPPTPADAVDMLSKLGTTPDQIVAPAEHLLGLTVGAVNPPGVRGQEPGLPTTYTRRGPGVGGSRKPDVAHYGGAEPSAATSNRTGLASIAANGDYVENCGTSFAAPNAAATLATLDHRLEHAQPRETILALPIHRASRGKSLSHSSLRHISREFVGFGVPPLCDELLLDDPYSITLIFNEALPPRQEFEFPFSWPKGLVTKTGACKGRVELTLAFTPPIDAAHKDEALRVELEAHLYQEQLDVTSGELEWVSQLDQDGSGVPQGMNKTEAYLLRTGLKWSPIKRYSANMPKGRGTRTNWILRIDSVTRAGATHPLGGVPFTLVMSISDASASTPIHDEIRNTLQSRGIRLADITVAHRVRPRG